jgi:crossover junction endodeoxyribonuclease RuvC
MIVLGVDPGSRRTGYGVIETDGRRQRLIEKGVLAPSPRLSLPERLRIIHQGIRELIERSQPDLLAVEDAFHAVNTRTALVLGQVRGVVLLAGAQAGLHIEEFPPATVKVQVTGYGRAEKQQVALMISRILELTSDAEAGDAADALAVALCGAQLRATPAAVATAPRTRSRPRRRSAS